jgi:hypothetical protein
MNDFSFYFSLGWTHIISIDALDHLLFILALTATYQLKDWKKVLILVTAFTIGHSTTLVLSSFDIIRFSSKWVEFLIPLTIVITGLLNFNQPEKNTNRQWLNYAIALFFGLIHGMGFANTIRVMLASSQSITIPLLGFNLGLEAGQIVVVTFILLMAWLLVTKARLNRKIWINLLSASAVITAIYYCIDRWPVH